MDAAAFNWTLLVIDHLNPSFLNFDLENNIRHPGAAGTELISLRVLINKPALTPEPLPVGGEEDVKQQGRRYSAHQRRARFPLETIR